MPMSIFTWHRRELMITHVIARSSAIILSIFIQLTLYYVLIIEKGCFIFVVTEKLKLHSDTKKLKFNVNVFLVITFNFLNT